MTQLRIVKDLDYDYIYTVHAKYNWWPFWIEVKRGLKEKMHDYVEACIKEGKVIKNPTVYQTSIN